MTWTNPADWDAWIKTLTGVGVAIAAAATRGQRISGWCRHRWTAWRQAAAERATEQQEAEKAIRVRDETIALLELRAVEWQRRYEDECREGDRKSAEIAGLRAWIIQLQAMKDGSPR